MGRKAVEMGRYGASELMRNKKLQKKAVNYGINKLTPFIQESVGTAMDQLSTKVRPKKKYKTDRKDLDGRSGRGVGGVLFILVTPAKRSDKQFPFGVCYSFFFTRHAFLTDLYTSHCGIMRSL